MTTELKYGDCLEQMDTIADSSVDMVLCGTDKIKSKKSYRCPIKKIISALPPFATESDFLRAIYTITRDGRVFRKIDGRELATTNGAKGYKYIRLFSPQFSSHKDGRKNYKIHRLVARFYLPNYSESLQVNHKNGDKKDNRVENLEMVTNQENAIHAWNELSVEKRKKRLSSSLKAYYKTHKIEHKREWIKNSLKPVARFKNGILDKRYECITDGAKDVGCSIAAISYCLKHGGKRKGFEWRLV